MHTVMDGQAAGRGKERCSFNGGTCTYLSAVEAHLLFLGTRHSDGGGDL